MAKTRLPDLKQLDKLCSQGKYKKVRSVIEAVPEEQWNAELKLRLALALNNGADQGLPEGRKDLRRALELLRSIEPEAQNLEDPFAFRFALGFSWFKLGHAAEALPHFQKAKQLVPFDPQTVGMIEVCREAIHRPKARWPFREGVRKAWETFEKQQPAILKQLETEQIGRCSKRLERMVSACLGSAFSKPNCSVWKTSGKPVLVCSVSTSMVGTIESLHFFQQAPANIREVWDFQIGPLPDLDSPAAQAFLKRYGDIPFHLFTGDEPYSVQDVMRTTPSAYLSAEKAVASVAKFYESLRSHLGLLPFSRAMDPAPEPNVPGCTVPLREVSSLLTAAGIDCSERYAEKMLEMGSYQTSKSPDSRKLWREANESGFGRISNLNEEDARRELFTNEMVQDGIEGGYLVWPITGGFKKKVQEETVQFQEQLQGQILEQLGDAYYYPIGRATDVDFAYLDCIAWDLQPVLETAAKLLQEAGIPWAAYQPYRDCYPAISLYGFDDESPLQQQN